MLRLAQERDRLTVIDDQIGAPTGADLLADVTAHAIRCGRATAAEALSGIYHLVAAGETSWYGYARFVLELCASSRGHAQGCARACRCCANERIFPTRQAAAKLAHGYQ